MTVGIRPFHHCLVTLRSLDWEGRRIRDLTFPSRGGPFSMATRQVFTDDFSAAGFPAPNADGAIANHMTDTSLAGQFRTALDGRILACNTAFLGIFGFSSCAEALSTSAIALHHDAASRERVLAKLREHGSIQNMEASVRRKDGSPLVVLCNLQLVKDEWGELNVVQGSILNITDQRRTEAALGESDAALRVIFTENPLPMFVYDRDSLRFLAVNEAALAQYGYTRAEFLTLRIIDVKPRGEGAVRGILTEPGPNGLACKRELKHCRRNGRLFDVEITTRPITLGDQKAVLAVVQDITSRRRAELERQITYDIIRGVNVTKDLDDLLQFIHRALRRVLYAENCYVALYDPSTEMFHFKFHTDKYDETPPPEPLNRGLTAYVLRSGKAMLVSQAVFDDLVARGEVELIGTPSPAWIGVPLRTPSATVGVLVLQHYEDGDAYTEDDLDFLSSVGSQIALAIERKRSEDALRSSEAHLRLLVEQLPAVLCTVDARMRFTSSVGSGLARLGQRPNQVVGMTLHEYFQTRDESFLPIAAHRRAMAGESVTFHLDIAGGSYTCHAEPLRGVDNRPVGAICMMLDVTDRKQLEAQLRQAQKMEAIGRLAGGVAHDFNNLLMVILGYCDLLLEGLREHDSLFQSAEQIRAAADRASTLTRQLLAFSRKQVLAPTVLDLHAVILEMQGMLRRVVGEDVDIVTTSQQGLWSVRADRNQIEQVIMNLAVNARDAMPRGGKLTIETSNVSFDETYSTERGAISRGSYVVLVVTDSGVGIAPEIQGRIFEPFFTTKDQGRGTGLGLATVYGIVQQSGGHVWVYSEPGHGSSFKIYLPRIEGPREVLEQLEPPNGLPRESLVAQRSETILVVEDEAGVRELTSRTLHNNGYFVMAAASMTEALEASNKHLGPIHLVLTDVVMPGGSGRELAEKLAVLRPEARVCYMSGYADQAVLDQGLLDASVSLLQKPFTASALMKRIRATLDAPQNPSA
jgi:two-component system cell cycle sensor histidine kinase/response regulator CckA